jgi:hypothetical protein
VTARTSALASSLVVALPLLGGCATTQYEPARSQHIARVSVGYVRDGIKYPEVLGGGLVEAVHGCRAATYEARSARKYLIAGFALSTTGVVAEGTGLALLIAGSKPANGTEPAHSTKAGNIGGAIALTGIIATIAGAIVIVQAPPKMLDAINMCNDEIDGRLPPQR